MQKGREQTCVAAACYSNILLTVSSPTESIWFLSCLLFCEHYRGYTAKTPLSLLPTLAFHFSSQAAPCSALALAFESESDGGTAGLRNNPTKRKKLVFHLDQLAESLRGGKNAGASSRQGEPWGREGRGHVACTEVERKGQTFSQQQCPPTHT